jgi:hypothetical protein
LWDASLRTKPDPTDPTDRPEKMITAVLCLGSGVRRDNTPPPQFLWKPSAFFSPAPGVPAGNQRVDLPEALTFAHLALATAESLARAAALTFRFFFFTGAAALAEAFLPLLTLAQRAFWAAPMRARAAADMRRFFRRPGPDGSGAAAAPAMDSSLLCQRSILSLIATTLRSSATVRS